MLMSHAAMSAAPTGWPRLGASAKAAPATSKAASQTQGLTHLCVGMRDLPRAVDRPAGDGVAVLVQNRRYRGDHFQLPALGDEFSPGRLRIAGLVPGAALQHCGAAIPAPGYAEAGECLAQHRLLQRRLGPAAPAIGRNHDSGYAAGAGIGDAGNFVEPGPFQG